MTQTVEQMTTCADWLLCAGCQRPIYGKRFIRNLRVCPECGRHQQLTARQRLAQLADDGRYEPLQLAGSNTDPLN
ncbi:MAG: acetyl-CoA carboxylase carboxyl transferase subunit beta, partial [Pseudonocardiaceae bacterium]